MRPRGSGHRGDPECRGGGSLKEPSAGPGSDRIRSRGGCMAKESGRYRWVVAGDVNGFFGLMFDNITVLSFLSGILVFAFGYPADIVYGRMFPGTAFGVLFGDLAYTWMAFR